MFINSLNFCLICGLTSEVGEAANFSRKGINFIKALSSGSENQLSIGIPLSKLYPKACSELSIMIVLERSLPKILKSLM